MDFILRYLNLGYKKTVEICLKLLVSVFKLKFEITDLFYHPRYNTTMFNFSMGIYFLTRSFENVTVIDTI